MKKYELTNETKLFNGVTLHRIKALKDFGDVKNFGDVKKGDLGGWIEKEENLNQVGTAWIFNDASVSGDARVSGNAIVSGNAWVYGDAWVSDNARVYDRAWVSDNARVYGNAIVSVNARVSGNACVSDNARVYGNAWVSGNTNLYGDADVFKKTHYLNIGAIGSRFGFTTFFRNVGQGIMVSCGCFLGTIEEFKEKVKETHGDNKHAQAYLKACELAELQIDLSGDGEDEMEQV